MADDNKLQEEFDEAVEAAAEENAEATEEDENTKTSEDTAAEENTESCETEEEDAEKSGIFKKKKEKKDKRDEQIAELNDKLVRNMAEFDNFRKRSEKEKSMMFDLGAKTIIEKILPVVDNFERGFTTVEEADRDDAFVQGMDKVYKQLMTELDSIGVKAIEAVGQEFDPELHNAVMQVESEEFETGVVAQELQKGYTYKDTVVRHSMVAVVQ